MSPGPRHRRHNVDRLGVLLRNIEQRERDERFERLARVVSLVGILIALAALIVAAAYVAN